MVSNTICSGVDTVFTLLFFSPPPSPLIPISPTFRVLLAEAHKFVCFLFDLHEFRLNYLLVLTPQNFSSFAYTGFIKISIDVLGIFHQCILQAPASLS